MSDILTGLAGAAAGGIANIIGIGASNNLSSKEAAKQRAWAESMWNKQNEYNSPQAMIARGLNPYLNPQAGIAQSVSQGASSTPQPYNLGTSISQGVNSVATYLSALAQSKKATAEAGLIDTQASWQDRLNQANLQKALGDTNYKNLFGRGFWTKERAELSAQLGLSNEILNLENVKQSISLMHAQEAYTILQADAQRVLNRFQTKQQTADLLNKAATYQLLIEQGRLTRRQAETEITKQVLNDAHANKIKVDTMPPSVASAVFDALAATSAYDARSARYRSHTKEYELDQSNKRADRNTKYWNSVNGSVNAIGNVIGSINPLKGLFRSGNSVGNSFSIPKGKYGYFDSSY